MKLKNYLLTVFSGLFMLTTAQIPTGYYDSAAGLSGAALKTKLSTIITNGHVDKGYAGLWTAYKTTDLDQTYEKDGSILDLYSENPTSTDPYKYIVTTNQCGTYTTEGNCYNREHVVPQSFFSSGLPMSNDINFVRPVDGYVNGMRSNNPYGMVGTTLNYTSKNGSKLGTSISAGFTGKVFEPLDEFKGDIARMVFYFVTRYENKLSTFPANDMLATTAFPGLQTWELNVLLQWNAQDPVSQAEINRNNASYTYQGNRNPFIDHPEYVSAIWGGTSTTDTTAPSVPASLAASNITSTSATVSWAASTDNVGVTGYKIFQNGTQVGASTSTSYNLAGLTAGNTYSITVQAYDAAGNNSAISTALSVTTTANTVDTSAPSVPSTLLASNITSTSATVSWAASTDNVGVIGYKVFQNGTQVGTSTTTSYNLTGLLVNTAYSITVQAYDAAGNSSASSTALSVTTVDTTAPSVPASLASSAITATSATVSWAASTDNVGVTGYKIFRNGTQVGTSTSTSYNLTGLTAATAYSITVQAYDAKGNTSVSSTALSITTSAAATFTELYFSEYLEGSSNNKAIEISNRTATAVNLSSYSIKKQVNGSTTWSAVATLSGSLATNATYVIAHTSYALTCTGNINLKTGNLDFNGNDTVGLFKNNVLIDIIGTSGSSANFAIDVTLRRNVSKPRATYLASEWTSYAVDTCSDIGKVNPTGTARMGSDEVNTNLQVTIYPNPVRNNEVFFKGQIDKIENVKIYDMNGKLIQNIDNPFGKGNRIVLPNLPKGIYWVIYGTQSKKIILE